jgi:hypothetical protein
LTRPPWQKSKNSQHQKRLPFATAATSEKQETARAFGAAAPSFVWLVRPPGGIARFPKMGVMEASIAGREHD